MKSFFINIILGFCLMLIFQSCHKDSTGPFEAYPLPVQDDTTWSPTDTVPHITDSIVSPAVVDSFNPTSPTSGITLGDSASIGFPTGGFRTLNSGDTTALSVTPTQKIRAEVLILKSKGDLIRHGMSSLDNNNALLEFGAYIRISLFCNGSPVFWKNPNHPFKVTIRDPKPTPDLQYYVYSPDSSGSVDSSWAKVGNGNSVAPLLPPLIGYQLSATNLGWFGCSRTLEVEAHSSIVLNVTLPSNCTNKNTVVYAVFNNSKTVVKLTPNHITQNFATGKIIPSNSNITLVSISKLKDGYYLGKLSTNPKASKIITLTPLKQINGLADVNNFLNSL